MRWKPEIGACAGNNTSHSVEIGACDQSRRCSNEIGACAGSTTLLHNGDHQIQAQVPRKFLLVIMMMNKQDLTPAQQKQLAILAAELLTFPYIQLCQPEAESLLLQCNLDLDKAFTWWLRGHKGQNLHQLMPASANGMKVY
jgi:hypothetical protein